MKPSPLPLENINRLTQPTNEKTALVVINHRETLIFLSLGSECSPLRIIPHHFDGKLADLHHPQNYNHATSKFEDPLYFRAIANELSNSNSILVFGCGKGSASEMIAFVDWLRRKRAPLAGRIVACQNVDTRHRTHAQLLAAARATMEQSAHRKTDPTKSKF